MEAIKSVWREDDKWFAVTPDGDVYELEQEVWSEGALVSVASWAFCETVVFPKLST
ncbi:hypothetical protein HLH33_17290 [Gluconacetobacter diazotrophicus]|uniref:Uncharacterized protein n=1 Tax=Gluconacetobacter diazotrophicus TaxID=33996 RepID=A0A7W4I848_GLUDI|nr:hypothetical protein [Gluconacetobacter diazotrophicus]MBB2158027.1 hypothetical protein [Gluconacetobacter diazotrophicus]